MLDSRNPRSEKLSQAFNKKGLTTLNVRETLLQFNAEAHGVRFTGRKRDQA